MWQIMWMLSLLPDWFYHLIVIFSLLALIVASVFKFIPYRLPIQVFGALLLLFGVWMEGGIVNEAKWEARVRELEDKVKIAEEKSKEKNVEIQEKVVTQTKVVKEKGKDIIQFIDREVVKKEEVIKYVENCPVPKDIIDAHNAAATLNKATEVKK
jgi:energy-coupling factor transporter transmembrane protein EcfT